MLAIGALLLLSIASGEIHPQTSRPVWLEYNNAGIPSLHVFSFLPDSVLTSGMQLLLHFPSQYNLNTLCAARLLPALNLACHVEDSVLRVEVTDTPELVDGRYALEIQGIDTPGSPGLTDYFRLELTSDDLVLDYNDYFDQVGIVPAFTSMPQPQISCQVCKTGDLSSYTLHLRFPEPLSPTLRVLLRVPDFFPWQSENGCSSQESAQIQCHRLTSDTIELRNVSSQVTTVVFSACRNPLSAGELGPLRIEVLDKGAATLIFRSPSFSLTLEPREILVEQICPNHLPTYCPLIRPHLSPGNLLSFNIIARTSNAIPAGGSLQVQFSEDFSGLEPGSCRVISGLQCSLGRTTCQVHPTNMTVSFHPAGPVSSGSFTVQLRLSTPLSPTGSFYLKTYAKNNRVIDESSKQVLTVEGIQRLQSVEALWSDPRAGSETKLSLLFRPSGNFTRGSIRLRLSPQELLVGVPSVMSCEMEKEINTFSTWSSDLGVLDIPLPAGTLPNTCTSSVDVTAGGGVIRLPGNPGLFPVEFLLNNGTMDVESFMVWVEIKASAFAEVSSRTVSREAGATSVVQMSLTPAVPIPSWQEGGRLELEFDLGTWGPDLGTGLAIGSALSCSKSAACLLVRPGVVQLHHFASIPENAPFDILLGGVRNPMSKSATVDVTAYRLSDGLQLLHSAVLSLGSLLHQKPASHSATVTLNSTSLDSPCNVTVSFSTMETGTDILVEMPGYYANSLYCELDGKVVTCSGFRGLVLVTGVAGLHVKSEHQIAILGMVTPNHIPSVNLLTLHLLQSGSELAKFEATLPPLIPGTIGKPTVTMDNNEAGSFDATYFFTFSPKHGLHQNGTVRIDFPADYILPLSIECEVNNAVAECWVQEHCVRVTTNRTADDVQVSVKISHVINPETAGWTSDFGIESFSEEGLVIDSNTLIPGISLSRKLPRVPLVHLGVRLTPNNHNFPGDLSLSFLPSSSLPKGTAIEVVFPVTEFPELPSHPHCVLSTLPVLNCTVNGSVLTVLTAGPYLRGVRPAPVTLFVSDLRPEGSALESGLFTVKLKYEGFLIDESPPSLMNRTLSFGPEPKTLTLVSFDYSPKTACEEAIYSFTFKPASDFLPSCVIGFRFGPQFSRKLSRNLQCLSKKLSAYTNEYVECHEENRTVIVSNTLGWQLSHSSETITVELRRLVNPSENLGPIAMYTQCGDTILDYLLATPAHTPDSIPQSLVLTSFESTSLAVGQISNITFTVTGIPTGRIFDLVHLSFSRDFDLDYVERGIICLSGLFHTPSIVSCSYEQGTIYIAAFPPEYMSEGSMEIMVHGVENPWEVLEVQYPVVSLYDATDDVIVAKTVPNLSGLPGLKFEKSLFYIEVNENRPWTQNKGTVSEFIYVTLEEPASQDFSISERGRIPGVKVSPYAVIFPKGSTGAKFRLEVGETAAKGNFTLEWNVNGAWYEPKYGARRFQLIITDLGNEQVLVNAAESVEQGGYANCTVMLQHAPSDELLLRVVKLSPQPSRVKFVPDVLRFGTGETSKQFAIQVDEDSFGDLGEFFIYREGINANAYYLPNSVFSFRVKPRENSPARVTALQVVETNRTSVRLIAATDKSVSLHWMIAWFGTRAPRLSELRASTFQGQLLEGPQFHYTRGSAAAPYRYEHEAIFSNLRAHTRYIVYTQIDEPNGGATLMCNFTTWPHMRSAYVTLRFRSTIQENERDTIRSEVARILTVSGERVLMLDSKRLNSTLTAQKPGSRPHLTHLVLVTDPYDQGSRSPRDQLSSLSSYRAELKTASVDLDTTADLTPVELPFTPPQWKTNPSLGRVTSQSARIDNVLLDHQGNIHICAIPKKDQPPTPLSSQIARGQDFYNEKCWYKTSLQTTSSHSSVLLSSLQVNSSYWVFLSADNDLPGLPDLLSDSLVQVIPINTLTTEQEKLSVKNAACLLGGGIWLLLS